MSAAAASDPEAIRSRMADLGIGTAHNTLANEGEDDNTTGASSNKEDDANRNMQISQL